MRKCIFFLFVFGILFLTGDVYGFDLKGLQPVAPYGVFSSFSAYSPQQGKTVIGLSAEKSREPDFYRYIFQYSYAMTDDTEISADIPYVEKWRDENSGFEDVSFGIKHRFIDEGMYGPSVAYMLNASVPSGVDEFSTDGRVGAGIIASKRIGPVIGHANIFYERAGSRRFEDEILFAFGFDFSAAHNFKVLGELYGRKSQYSSGIDQIEGRFGYRFFTTEYLFTTIGAGFDLKNRTPEYRVLFSISAVLPIEGKKVKMIYEEDK
ncbi:MAG: hypothetical protein HY755_02855 [Nitrospirae bacterium]|nr:hypothetical protein [Nitrospirota bacterium]